MTLFLVLATATGAWAQRRDESLVRPPAEARLPGLEAASGLLGMPSAYVQRSREATAFVLRDRNTTGGAILLGWAQRMELGVGVGDRGAESARAFGSAKVNVIPEALFTPAVSVGVLDAFDTTGTVQSGYAAVSKTVIPYFLEALTGQKHLTLKLHGGYGGGLYRNRPFAGVELWSGNGVGALGEVVSGRANVGARYYRRGVGLTLGWLEGKRVGGSLGYTLPWK